MSDKDERAQRLAAQLRANLRRRKTQAREVAASANTANAPAARDAPGTAAHDED
jgi:hypothetical protein